MIFAVIIVMTIFICILTYGLVNGKLLTPNNGKLIDRNDEKVSFVFYSIFYLLLIIGCIYMILNEI